MAMPSSDVVAVPAFPNKRGLEIKRARATNDIRLKSLRIALSRTFAARPDLAYDSGS